MTELSERDVPRIPGAGDAVTGLVARLRAAGCVFAEDEAALLLAAAVSPQQLEQFVVQRVGGLPIEHVVGWARFCGLRILVSPGVFVPRPRTEFLVGQARRVLSPGSIVLDLCCGSGAVGVAVAEGNDVQLYASDLEPVAVTDARRNVEPIGGRVFEGDLYAPLPPALRDTVDVITVIAPYVPTDAMALLPHEARDFEPVLALDGGPDGLEVVRRIVMGAGDWLASRGTLFAEVSQAQAGAVVHLIEGAGLIAATLCDEDTDCWVVTATRS